MAILAAVTLPGLRVTLESNARGEVELVTDVRAGAPTVDVRVRTGTVDDASRVDNTRVAVTRRTLEGARATDGVRLDVTPVR